MLLNPFSWHHPQVIVSAAESRIAGMRAVGVRSAVAMPGQTLKKEGESRWKLCRTAKIRNQAAVSSSGKECLSASVLPASASPRQP
jgi:hypothetical protein